MTSNASILHYQDKLLEKGFLWITQQYPIKLDKPESFTVDNGISCKVLDTGVLILEPSQKENLNNSIDIILSCGIHGNETGPIEMLDSIVNQVLHGKTPLRHRVMFIIGNPEATLIQKRFVDENLNRLFCGRHKNRTSKEAQRATCLEQYVTSFFSNTIDTRRIHYDLHTAIRASCHEKFIVYPYPHEKGFNLSHLKVFRNAGIKTVLLSNKPSTTFSYFSSRNFSAEAFTIELGKVEPFGKNDPQALEPVKEQLFALLANNVSEVHHNDYSVYEVKHELIKKSEKFTLHIDANVKNFQTFPLGYRLTSDIDGSYTTSVNEEAIIFPNTNVPIGQRAGLVVIKKTNEVSQ